MKKVSLLDCTLRDGGYVNDWKFGHSHLISIFERLIDSNVDIIEIGFLDKRRPFDIDRSIMPDTKCADKIYEKLERKKTMLVGMIDYGTCSIENLQPCENSCLDGIRVIFKKHLMNQAMEFCRKVKALGYKVFSQLVSITSYNDKELMELINLVNEVKPYCVSIVDTYGLLYPEDVLHYYEILDNNVEKDIRIGFHAHNNFQLGYANSLAFIDKKTNHDIVVDGTLYGMGKSAGNAPIELIAMRLNNKFNKNYNISPMLEAIEESIMEFYSKSPWGYKMLFYICAKNRCHPNYFTYYESKRNLSISKIDHIMSKIEPEEKKLLYDNKVADELYKSFIEGEYSDYKDRLKFVKEIARKRLLILGPGKNIQIQKDKVNSFIEEYAPYIIAINYIPDGFKIDCVFVTNGKRYHDMTLKLKNSSNIKFLATTNVECRNGSFDFVINRAPLLEDKESIIDNSFLMLLKFFKSIDIDELYCAGFDGYSDKEDNYCNPTMEYFFVKQKASHLNFHMKNAIADFRKTMNIKFITYSAYDEVEDINGASI